MTKRKKGQVDSGRKKSADDRGRLLRAFRKFYAVTLEQMAEIAGLSQPMLTRFETGTRNISVDAWTRVTDAMRSIAEEKGETATKMLNPPVGLSLWNIFKAEEQRTKEYAEAEAAAATLQELQDGIASVLAVAKSKTLRQLKNPKFAKQLLEHYWALIEWRQKLLDLEAKGYAMRPKPKSIEEVIFELDAQGFAVIPKSMFEQLKARVAELEKELRAYQELLPRSTRRIEELEQELKIVEPAAKQAYDELLPQANRRIAELEQELARERANKAGDSPG